MNAQHDKWLIEALSLPATSFVDHEEAEAYLRPLLTRCQAKSRKTFWQWIRINLAKTPEAAVHLEWMVESKLPPEAIPQPADDFPHTISADGTTALIPVGEGDVRGIWKIHVQYLDWARDQFPVWLKRLPDLEPVERRRQRDIKHSLRYARYKMSSEQISSLQDEIDDLDRQVDKLYPPIPRYQLMRTENRRDVEVHRLFIGATEDDQVSAIDGDFLNFADTPIRMTVEAVVRDGYIPASRREPVTSEISVPNLQIIESSAELQKKFEAGHLQMKYDDHGQVVSPIAFDSFSGEIVAASDGRTGHSLGLEVRPNADLGQVWNTETGKFESAGKFDPVMPSEGYSPEKFKRKPQKSLNPDRIREAWRRSRRDRGFRK